MKVLQKCSSFEEAEHVMKSIKKLTYVIVGDEGDLWVVDLQEANRLIKNGYRLAVKEEKISEDITEKKPEKYGIQKVDKNCHRIVKILKEYDNEKQAIDDMARLVTGELTEKELVEGRKEE